MKVYDKWGHNQLLFKSPKQTQITIVSKNIPWKLIWIHNDYIHLKLILVCKYWYGKGKLNEG